jgi:hypothetical protein
VASPSDFFAATGEHNLKLLCDESEATAIVDPAINNAERKTMQEETATNR